MENYLKSENIEELLRLACWILRQLFIIFSRRLSLITRFAIERVFVSISCQFLQFDSTFDYKRVRDSYENELSG